jgi:hypothetical protein
MGWFSKWDEYFVSKFIGQAPKCAKIQCLSILVSKNCDWGDFTHCYWDQSFKNIERRCLPAQTATDVLCHVTTLSLPTTYVRFTHLHRWEDITDSKTLSNKISFALQINLWCWQKLLNSTFVMCLRIPMCHNRYDIFCYLARYEQYSNASITQISNKMKRFCQIQLLNWLKNKKFEIFLK